MGATPTKTRRALRQDKVGDKITLPPYAQQLADQVPHFDLVEGRQWLFNPTAPVPCGVTVIVRFRTDSAVENYAAEVVEYAVVHQHPEFRQL